MAIRELGRRVTGLDVFVRQVDARFHTHVLRTVRLEWDRGTIGLAER